MRNDLKDIKLVSLLFLYSSQGAWISESENISKTLPKKFPNNSAKKDHSRANFWVAHVDGNHP